MQTCGCGVKLEGKKEKAEIKTLTTGIGWRDVLGGWRVRWGIGRMQYRVTPGLYRIGQPDQDSEVLVTANYKLTVDRVRRELAGLDVWLLILDTDGVNVWCAAGKGTFGTGELIRRIQLTDLDTVVRHRRLILPQLGATGVAAHEVRRASGFSVRYGPVRAADIRAFLAAGLKATPDMRRVTFNWKERLVVVPMEIAGALKHMLIILAALFILNLAGHRDLTQLPSGMIPFLGAMLTGGLVVPLLLPWLPFRPFALKGALAGLLFAAASWLLLPAGIVEGAGTSLLVIAITSYMAMLFTGATTFTTLAGARLEVRWALPPILVLAVAGAVLRAVAVFI